ncbi:MAG: 50S ribosomal protein L11 methyltransferase [Pseudanabaenaceae cyanobacterium bins.39]|nr:50S ribosomal protein L11 methyltransferase [Pseudanabaenaceae cyanobacterium bins.39]
MDWIELSIDATSEAVDWVYTLLANHIAPEDIHISPPNPPWSHGFLLYIANNGQVHHRISLIDDLLRPLQRTAMISDLQVAEVAAKPQNLDSAWRRSIGDRFVIQNVIQNISTPTAEYLPTHNDDKLIIYLPNSLAFGTGWHPATILSLRLLEKYTLPSHTALDLGSGSGILSVAMAKLGAKVIAIDNDPLAVAATQAAISQNQLDTQITASCSSLGSGAALGHWLGGDRPSHVSEMTLASKFDVIAANIFARVHISLAPEYAQALNERGKLITAGYTSDRAEDITNAMQAVGLGVCDRLQIEDWVAIAFQKDI